MKTASVVLLLAALLSMPAEAKSHFNSKRRMITDPTAGPAFKSIVMADMNGDGLKEFVGFTQDSGGFKISIGTTGYGPTVIASFDSHFEWWNWRMPNDSVIQIREVFVGKFTSTSKENFCFRSRANYYAPAYDQIFCFELVGSTIVKSLGSATTVPIGWTAGRGVVTGDFDGDGLDELLTYNTGDGSDVRMFAYNQPMAGDSEGGLIEKNGIDPGNLTAFSAPGSVEMHVGNFANHAGESIRDDLFVLNTYTRQSWVFHARKPGAGLTTFWGYVGPVNGTTWGNEEVSVADADGDGYEDLIAHDTLYGNNRFLTLNNACVYCAMPYKQPESGQLPWYGSANETHLYFGKMAFFWGEGGNTNTRDDVMLLDVPAKTYHRYDARWCPAGSSGCGSAGARTYWYLLPAFAAERAADELRRRAVAQAVSPHLF